MNTFVVKVLDGLGSWKPYCSSMMISCFYIDVEHTWEDGGISIHPLTEDVEW